MIILECPRGGYRTIWNRKDIESCKEPTEDEVINNRSNLKRLWLLKTTLRRERRQS